MPESAGRVLTDEEANAKREADRAEQEARDKAMRDAVHGLSFDGDTPRPLVPAEPEAGA